MHRRTSLLLLLGLAACEAAPQREARADYTESIQHSDVTFDMVWIPEGNFWIGKTEVTWDEFLAYCDFGERESTPPGVDVVARPSKPLETFPYDRDWGVGKRPAVGMAWNSAQKYCEWLSKNTGHAYRLPTEAEWRQACGDAPAGDLDDYAWFAANSDEMSHEVAQKKPNAHGLYDMLGNLQEYTSEPFDPAAPEWAALRGGSWEGEPVDVTPDARAQFDEFWILDDPNIPAGVWWVPDGPHIGFRVLRAGDETAD